MEVLAELDAAHNHDRTALRGVRSWSDPASGWLTGRRAQRQKPLLQLRFPLESSGQAWPQSPQLLGSKFVFVQIAPQRTVPSAHGSVDPVDPLELLEPPELPAPLELLEPPVEEPVDDDDVPSSEQPATAKNRTTATIRM